MNIIEENSMEQSPLEHKTILDPEILFHFGSFDKTQPKIKSEAKPKHSKSKLRYSLPKSMLEKRDLNRTQIHANKDINDIMLKPLNKSLSFENKYIQIANQKRFSLVERRKSMANTEVMAPICSVTVPSIKNEPYQKSQHSHKSSIFKKQSFQGKNVSIKQILLNRNKEPLENLLSKQEKTIQELTEPSSNGNYKNFISPN